MGMGYVNISLPENSYADGYALNGTDYRVTHLLADQVMLTPVPINTEVILRRK